jgi:hypothetical protein
MFLSSWVCALNSEASHRCKVKQANNMTMLRAQH